MTRKLKEQSPTKPEIKGAQDMFTAEALQNLSDVAPIVSHI